MKENFKERMNETQQKLKAWWETLAIREKQAVLIGGSALVIFIIYAGIWQPYVTHMTNMRKQILTDQKTLQWMMATDKEIKKMEGQVQNKNKPISAVALLGILQRQTQQAGLSQYVTQLKQGTNDSIEMHFQKVEFDSLMKLLAAVIKEHNVSIAQMSTVSGGTPGVVDADIVIKLM